MPRRLTIHLIDDDASVRRALSFALSAAGYSVRTYEAASAFLEAEPELEAGIVITDVRMPGLSGIELLHRLGATARPWKVLVISGHGDIPMAVEAMRAGACEFIEKPFEPDLLIDRLAALVADPAEPQAADPFFKLSPRETEVLARIVRGQTSKMIALELGISHRTVEVHRAALMSKTGSRHVSDLVRLGMAHGF